MSGFLPGDRIEMTAVALARGLAGGNSRVPPSKTGVVVAVDGCFLVVRRDGRKQMEKYSSKFWRKEPRDE